MHPFALVGIDLILGGGAGGGLEGFICCVEHGRSSYFLVLSDNNKGLLSDNNRGCIVTKGWWVGVVLFLSLVVRGRRDNK